MNQTSKNALHDPKYWRNLAREARREADQLSDGPSKQFWKLPTLTSDWLIEKKKPPAGQPSGSTVELPVVSPGA